MSINGSVFAPIALLAYNRPAHLERCLASLRLNPECARTVLYCYLDGPRCSEDARMVEQVRGIARAATGFRAVNIVERDCNWGLSRNVIGGVTQVLAHHEKVIVVEDDLEVSSTFLRYMNEALSFYASSPEVFSVSAYNYPKKLFSVPKGYPFDAFFVQRHMCWGWGTWRDRWQRADWQVRDYDSLSRSESWQRSFREGGVDLPGMLDAQVHGQVDSWAIRWTHAHFTHHAVCLVPVESFVNNMGADGSGVHMKRSNRYFHPTLNNREELRLPSLVYVDPFIARMYKTVERRSLAFRAVRKVSRMVLGVGSPGTLSAALNQNRASTSRG